MNLIALIIKLPFLIIAKFFKVVGQLLRGLVALGGVSLILIGLITLFTPAFPAGFVMIILGVIMAKFVD